MTAPLLIVPVGPPGCGKSTIARNCANNALLDSFAMVSSDHYRKMLTGNEEDQKANSYVFEILDLVIEARLRNGLDVYVDATNMTRMYKWADMAERTKAELWWVVFPLDSKTYRARNEARDRVVPEPAMTRLLDQHFPATVAVKRMPGIKMRPENLWDRLTERSSLV